MLEQALFAASAARHVSSANSGRGRHAEGKYVSWLPSYGPEMRGTANCSVVLSDREIIPSLPILTA